MKLSEIDKILLEVESEDVQNYDAAILEKLLHDNRTLLIYGVGAHSDKVMEACWEAGLHPEAFIVDDCYYVEGMTAKLPVRRALEYNLNECNVLLGFINVNRTKELKPRRNFYQFWNLEKQYSWTLDYVRGNKENFEYAYDMLEDDFSKELFVQLIKANLTSNPDCIMKYADDDQYFNNITKDDNDEYYVDCGAFIGDTLDDFERFCEGRCKGAVCFEPDYLNYNKLLQKAQNYKNVECINEGCWDSSTTLFFKENGSAGQIVEENIADTSVTVTAIDNICKGRNVTFIKMDIEGAEERAILGARNTIVKYKPKLAICCYHKATDIWNLMRVISSLVGDYKFYLRHHSNGICETVLYAVQ